MSAIHQIVAARLAGKRGIGSSDCLDKTDKILLNLALATAVLGIGGAVGHGIYDNVRDTVMQEAYESNENTMLFKAAKKDDLEKFKGAVAQKANLKALNAKGDNCLILALRCMGPHAEDNAVVREMLSNPEICKQIDFKVVNKDGLTAIDIIKAQIKYRETDHTNEGHERFVKGKPATNFQKFVLSKIQENLERQNQEEAKGQARSKTKYDAFSVAMQNKGNTGK